MLGGVKKPKKIKIKKKFKVCILQVYFTNCSVLCSRFIQNEYKTQFK